LGSGKTVDEAERTKIVGLREQYSVAYIAKHMDRSKSEIYKVLRQEAGKPEHFRGLAETARKLADNLDNFRKSDEFWGNTQTASEHTVGEIIYGPGTVHQLPPQSFIEWIYLEVIDQDSAADLLVHLKTEFKDLKGTPDWAQLTQDKVTEQLITQLRSKGYQEKFKGKCPRCPK
jgi:hypothetical protein